MAHFISPTKWFWSREIPDSIWLRDDQSSTSLKQVLRCLVKKTQIKYLHIADKQWLDFNFQKSGKNLPVGCLGGRNGHKCWLTPPVAQLGCLGPGTRLPLWQLSANIQELVYPRSSAKISVVAVRKYLSYKLSAGNNLLPKPISVHV